MYGYGDGYGERRGYSSPGGTVPASAYDPDAAAWMARMVPAPSPALAEAINALILALKAGGGWGVDDAFYVEALHSDQAGRRNAVQDLYNLTGVNSPAFAALGGFTGDGSTSYMRSGFDPTAAPSAKYKQNDAHMAVWLGTDLLSNAFDCGARDFARIGGRSATLSATMRTNSTTGDTPILPIATAIGYSMWSRDNSANFKFFKNGVLQASITRASNILTSAEFFALAVNSTGTTAVSHSARQQRAFSFGGHLTDAEAAARYAALSAFFSTTGSLTP